MTEINTEVPVSRADYDQMADQRDAFRAALKTAETYLEGVLTVEVDYVEPGIGLATIEGLARHGLDAVKKALQSAR